MYEKRIKVFIALTAALLLLCVARLAQLQFVSYSAVQKHLAELKARAGSSHLLKTIRGRILDRNGIVLAADDARYHLAITYRASSILDARVQKAILLQARTASRTKSDGTAVAEAMRKIDSRLQDLDRIIDDCTVFHVPREEIEQKIRRINDEVWDRRTFFAWWRDKSIEKPGGANTRISEAVRDFENRYPDEEQRIRLVYKVDDIREMYAPRPLFELKTDDEIFTAELEFRDVEGVEILVEERRFYPYHSCAAQTIGWVAPALARDRALFPPEKDPNKLSVYLPGDLAGRQDGAEYVCETILRGKRGKIDRDIDKNLINEIRAQIGNDVRLAIDIRLQKRIEEYLLDYGHDPNCGPGFAAVVIEVASGDILAMVSLPSFDLNLARTDWDQLSTDPDLPLTNRAINAWYPPGSVVKPIILIAAMQTGKITAEEVISCPSSPAADGPPNCWIFNRYSVGHDSFWTNNARNAIKGSCNIYFSRLAERVEPRELQRWLFAFGYGRTLIPPPAAMAEAPVKRNFRQSAGQISSRRPAAPVCDFEQVPPLSPQERRWFGIGHGKLITTPLQVANAMAVIARGGKFKPPQLFLDDPNGTGPSLRVDPHETDLGISPGVLETVYDGMHAVVNENQGTAHKAFVEALDRFEQEGITIYGKTGSTEAPDHAWFAGFAEDSGGRKISLAVVAEGGQSGARDAAPLGRDIIQFAVEAGYLGRLAEPPGPDAGGARNTASQTP